MPPRLALEDEHDPSKLSLAERMRLFERPPAPAASAPTPPSPARRRRALTSRFQTQPITVSEVPLARQISPADMRRPPVASLHRGLLIPQFDRGHTLYWLSPAFTSFYRVFMFFSGIYMAWLAFLSSCPPLKGISWVPIASLFPR